MIVNSIHAKMLRIRAITWLLSRSDHVLSCRAVSASALKVDKEALKKLRERTGYSYVNCRKALVQFGPDHLDDAIKWLRELAEKEGWEKAAKLSSRQTKNGLVSTMANGNTAALVEVNCETDFVARGENFKKLVEEVTRAVFNAAKSKSTALSSNGRLNVVDEGIESLICADGRPVKEVLAMAVGKLGENIIISRTQSLVADPTVSLIGCTHPRDETNGVGMGRYAAIVGLKRQSVDSFPTERLGQQICQHVIGMRSESMGTPPEEGEEQSRMKTTEKQGDTEKDESNDFCDEQTTYIDESETRLLRQSFMLNPSQSVYEYLRGHGATVVDFLRAEVGQTTRKED